MVSMPETLFVPLSYLTPKWPTPDTNAPCLCLLGQNRSSPASIKGSTASRPVHKHTHHKHAPQTQAHTSTHKHLCMDDAVDGRGGSCCGCPSACWFASFAWCACTKNARVSNSSSTFLFTIMCLKRRKSSAAATVANTPGVKRGCADVSASSITAAS